MTIIDTPHVTAPPVAPERLALADILDGAAWLIERDGWADNGMSYPRRCVVMAIAAQAIPGDAPMAAMMDTSKGCEAVRVMEQFLGLECHVLPDWNDLVAGSSEVVCDTLRACAIAVRSGLL